MHPGKDKDCWHREENAHKRPSGWKPYPKTNNNNNGGDRKKKFDEAVSRAVLKATQQIKDQLKKKKSKKRRERHNGSGDALDNYAIALGQAVQAGDSDSGSSLSEDSVSQNTNSSPMAMLSPYAGSDDDSSSSQSTGDTSSTGASDSGSSDDVSHISVHKAHDYHTSPLFSYDSPNHCCAFCEHSRVNKKRKTSHYTAETVVEIEDRYGKIVPIRCLVDTGTSHSIVLRAFVRKGRAKSYKGKTTSWNTMGGTFTTKQKALIDFSFPELDPGKKVTWICHADTKTEKANALYDMIIGLDLLTEIGLYVNTETKMLYWEGHTAPLKERGALGSTFMLQELYAMSVNPVLKEAEERQAHPGC